MAEQASCVDPRLSRQEISDDVTRLGWRYNLGLIRTSIGVGSLAQAAEVAQAVTALAGDSADGSLSADLRPDRVILTLQSRAEAWVTHREIELAERISAAAADQGLATESGVGAGAPRSVQVVEIAIDALDIAGIRPFWKAVMGYDDEPGGDPGPGAGLADPLAQFPSIWFQQMDEPRPQRNRIHLDVVVPHDEVDSRMQAALAAGGTLVYDAEAPAFWVLADPEGNGACLCTWQGRDH